MNRRIGRLLFLLLLLPTGAGADTRNGFDLSESTVPAAEILSGGPPRDGIPALTGPDMVPAASARYLREADLVLGVFVAGEARAYPKRLLVWHEIVNDTVAGQPIAVTFCPLCGSGVVFDRQVNFRTLEFGVSGLLFNSDMLMYDRETESLWSQIPGDAVAGPLAGSRLDRLAAWYMPWKAWRTRHPDTLVMSQRTGFERDYDHYPYAGYEQSADLYFPVRSRDSRFHPKQRVLGLQGGREARAWPLSELRTAGPLVRDRFRDQPVTVHYDPATGVAEIRNAAGEPLPAMDSFWFAWSSFFPHTTVFTAP